LVKTERIKRLQQRMAEAGMNANMLHPGEGVVKLEDTILVTDKGAEILNISPK